jgi:exocyst complex component 2
VRQGRYDVALRDYKKGKFLLDSRPGQLLPLPSSSGSSAKEVEAQQRRVLDKVWANVEKAMGEMRNVLVGMLRDEARSVEEQERTIE